MSMKSPSVIVVVPVYNDAATIAACVRSVFEHTVYESWKLVVVDDGSTDRSMEMLRGFREIQVIKKSRGGVASAVNRAARMFPGMDVVRLHADVVIETPDWLRLLIEAAYSQPKAGIVGARLVYPDGRIQSEGRSIVSGLGFHVQHRQRKAFAPDGAVGKVHEVDSVAGALAYYRRDAINATGGLDENYGPAWVEDDDFCIAARRRDFKVYVHPGVRAVHFVRSRPPTFTPYIPGNDAALEQITHSLKNAAERKQTEYWEAKWGWNPYYPDIGEIRRLYGRTEICWQIGAPLRFKPSSEFPTVDCCLVTWNTLPLLRRCLESLAVTDYPPDRIKVYIADNCSTDGTIAYLDELVESYPFKLNVIKLPVNTGAPLGLNFTVVQGRGELVARLDDDIVLPPDWLKLMVVDLLRRPYAGCIGPKIINDDDKQAIQCGPYRHYPGIYGHDDEVDHGQADYFSRTTHVRGCCNLYRRDVFARCGLFDLRFSPSQCDDPDHHIALLHAGYEILYDGRVRVIHKLNNGLARSAAALTNHQGNQTKMVGKWGRDVWEILECSIDLSREGRYLPGDGDTEGWMARGPGPELFPRRTVAGERKGLVARIYEELSSVVEAGSSLDLICSDYISLALIKQRDGAPRFALDILLVAANFAPLRGDVLKALAKVYQALGQTTMGRLMARRGLHLLPADAELAQLAEAAQIGNNSGAGTASGGNMIAQMNAIGELAVRVDGASLTVPRAGSSIRVLMVNTFTPRIPGGDQSQLKKTRQYLQELGAEVDICCSPSPDPRGYDVIHLWNTWFPHETLTQVKAIRASMPNIPIVLSPIYWDLSEKTWADHAVPAVFAKAVTLQQLDQSLQQLASGALVMNGVARLNARDGCWPAYETYQKQLFGLVDYLLPQSQAEMVNLKKTLGIAKPYSVIENAAECTVFDQATSDWFISNYGIKEFVVTVGLIEPRKNQLMLLYALRDSGLPIVVIGRHYDRNYYQLCRKFAPAGTVFIDHLPHEQLASALKAARVFALPSWAECASLANIEAALCGCSLAVSDRTSEKEYFGSDAYYCAPSSVESIRSAVTSAFRNHQADAEKRARLSDRFRTHSTWQLAAQKTLAGFREAIAGRQQAVAA